MQSKDPRLIRWLDRLLPILIGVVSFWGYHSTLAPTVLDGDAALFQYAPAVLGVTYPTGYPTYLLLGFVWQALWPWGSVAYRMNLFSAVCAALALTLLYSTARRLLESRIAALCAVAVFATLPTFWRWATEAKIYTLHILLLSAMLLVLSMPEQLQKPRTWLIGAVLFGLAVGNHSTTLLLAPGLALMFWLVLPRTKVGEIARPMWVRRFLYLLPAVGLPALLYLYVPVRAEWLLNEHGTLSGLNVPVAVARGLVSEYYHSGWDGWLRYFTAADFTGGVVRNWERLPSDLQTVYYPLMRDDFTQWGLVGAAIGACYYAIWRPRRFWPLCLLHVALVPFVLTYGQGEQSAFLLPASLTLALFAGAGVAAVGHLTQAVATFIRDRRPTGDGDNRTIRVSRAGAQLAVLAIVAFSAYQQSDHNVRWLTEKWNDATYRYWADALAHPIEPGAGLLAHWGDLTSFWYLQHTEGLRRDLYGIYPPQRDMVEAWLAAGHDLYIAGPLQAGTEELAAHYHLLPWGRLVRLLPRETAPETALPDLPVVPGEAIFGRRLRLTHARWGISTASGELLPVTLLWCTMDEIPTDVRISLRLVDMEGRNVAQLDDTLLSGWLPESPVAENWPLLSFNRLRIPTGILPGQYRLQVGVYHKGEGEWPLLDGAPLYTLGDVEVTAAPPGAPADPWQEFKPAPEVVFGDAIRLVGYDYSVTRARQGRGFALRLLWQAEREPEGDYILAVELIDALGNVWRDWHLAPVGGRLPTSRWKEGQTVRDEIPLVLPALAPPGAHTMWTRLAWLRADGSRLPARYGWLPWGDSVVLPGVRVIEQEDRTFEMSPYTDAVGARFGDKAILVGYHLPEKRFCQGSVVPLELIWRSLSSDIRKSYTVFVHLVDRDGTILTQADKEPGPRGKRPTTSWVQDEIIRDPIPLSLPPDIPAGAYRLLVGLYTEDDGVRLPVYSISGVPLGDSLVLTEVQVVNGGEIEAPAAPCP